MTKKLRSTFDQDMQDAKRRKQFDKEYRDLVLSELLLALMEEDEVSVRELAKEAGVSPTVIQQIRSGEKGNLTLATLISILDALGYTSTLEIEKKSGAKLSPKRFSLSSPSSKKRPHSRLRSRRKMAI